MPNFRNGFTGKSTLPVLKGKNTILRFKKIDCTVFDHCPLIFTKTMKIYCTKNVLPITPSTSFKNLVSYNRRTGKGLAKFLIQIHQIDCKSVTCIFCGYDNKQMEMNEFQYYYLLRSLNNGKKVFLVYLALPRTIILCIKNPIKCTQDLFLSDSYFIFFQRKNKS